LQLCCLLLFCLPAVKKKRLRPLFPHLWQRPLRRLLSRPLHLLLPMPPLRLLQRPLPMLLPLRPLLLLPPPKLRSSNSL